MLPGAAAFLFEPLKVFRFIRDTKSFPVGSDGGCVSSVNDQACFYFPHVVKQLVALHPLRTDVGFLWVKAFCFVDDGC